MKLTIHEDPSAGETEITIRCPFLDSRQFQLPLESIYYLESTDGTTFVYQEKEVYACRETLAALEPQLSRSGFARISKSCILNISFLEYVEPLFNHRMKATLKNGEALIISRNYIAPLRDLLKGDSV